MTEEYRKLVHFNLIEELEKGKLVQKNLILVKINVEFLQHHSIPSITGNVSFREEAQSQSCLVKK